MRNWVGITVATTIAALGLSAAGTSAAATCGPKSGYTEVARSDKGRILVKGKPRSGPGGTALATSAVACRFRDGLVQRLGVLGEDEDMIGMSGFVMAGSRVAYVLRARSDEGDSGPSDYATVVQEVLGRKNAAVLSTQAPTENLRVDIALVLALAPDGAMAWSTCETSDGDALFPVACKRTSKAQWAIFGGTLERLRDDDRVAKTLAKGTGKLPSALSVRGGVLRFVQNGRRRSARL